MFFRIKKKKRKKHPQHKKPKEEKGIKHILKNILSQFFYISNFSWDNNTLKTFYQSKSIIHIYWPHCCIQQNYTNYVCGKIHKSSAGVTLKLKI